MVLQADDVSSFDVIPSAHRRIVWLGAESGQRKTRAPCWKRPCADRAVAARRSFQCRSPSRGTGWHRVAEQKCDCIWPWLGMRNAWPQLQGLRVALGSCASRLYTRTEALERERQSAGSCRSGVLVVWFCSSVKRGGLGRVHEPALRRVNTMHVSRDLLAAPTYHQSRFSACLFFFFFFVCFWL